MKTRRKIRGRRLQYEALEPREVMAAGVTASLKSGVLRVVGTTGNDQLNFKQGSSNISIAGVSGSWSASNVKSISIDLKGGNDVVSLNSLANGGKKMLAENISILSGAGNDLVHLANGHDVTFSGVGHTLVVSTNGTATLDGQVLNWNNPSPPPQPNPSPTPSNWFDSHVTDAALRSLGHTLYTDSLIDRNDIIAILRNAEDGGSIDATELTDLRSIASTTTLFGTLDYVRKLTSYIIDGSVANRNYQGQALGGLNAGSTAAQMEKFVNKWFLGLDHPTASGTYRQFAGTLFVNGPSYSDVHQGAVGDCYFVASLGEAAFRNPALITSMFVTNGDGTYTVRFYGYMGADYVTVDSYLPTYSGGQAIYANRGQMYNNSSNELWVALAEKAYAQLNEFGWSRGGFTGSGNNSYDAISGGYINAAMMHITGQSTVNFAMTSSSTSFTTFVNAYNAGKMIGFASYSSQPAGSSIVGSHAYAVVGYNASNQTVTFFNPWGTEFGLVTLTWAQVKADFQYFDRTA